MDLQYKTLSLKAAPAKEGDAGLKQNEFDGYGSTFMGPVDSYGEIIAPTAFDASLDFFKEDGMILWQHRTSTPIGKPVECFADTVGLYLKGLISDTTDGRDALTLLRDRVIKKMSIGFITEGYEVLSQERGVEVLGQDAYDKAIKNLPWYVDNLTLLTQVKLYEVSLVSFPANTAADVLGVKSLQGLAARLKTKAEFERALTDVLGFSQANARLLSASGYDALQKSTEPKAPADDAEAIAVKAALKSLTGIFKLS